jgi:hypothetical protein
MVRTPDTEIGVERVIQRLEGGRLGSFDVIGAEAAAVAWQDVDGEAFAFLDGINREGEERGAGEIWHTVHFVHFVSFHMLEAGPETWSRQSY